MAFEREQKNVAIGNMPYVAPSSSAGIANFAQGIQDDVVKQRKKIKDDNDRLFVARGKAAIFDTLTGVQLEQETPNSFEFGKQAGKQLKKIIETAENAEQRNALQISATQIASQFTNNIAQKEATYNSDVNIEETKKAGVDVVDRHNQLTDDMINDPKFVNGSFEEIDGLAQTYQRMSQGRITPETARLWARDRKTEIQQNIAFRTYMENLRTSGVAVADSALSEQAKAWAKTAKEENTFRSSVRTQLNTMEIKQEIKLMFQDRMEIFAKASFKKKQEMLPLLREIMPVELYAKAEGVVESGKVLIASANTESGIETALLPVTTETELDAVVTRLESLMKTAKDVATLKSMEMTKREEIFKDTTTALADATKDRVKAIKQREISLKVREIKMNGPDGVDITYFSDGSPILQPGYISTLESAKTTWLTTDREYKKWKATGSLTTPNTIIQTGINNAFNKAIDYQAFLLNGTPEIANEITDFVVDNKFIPTTITDSLKFKNLVHKPVNEIKNLAGLVATIDTNENKNVGVTQSLGNLDPATRVFLDRFALVSEEKQASYISQYQALLVEANNDSKKMEQNKIAAEITTNAPEGEIGLMEQSYADFVADSMVTDVFKAFTNHFSPELPWLKTEKKLDSAGILESIPIVSSVVSLIDNKKWRYMSAYMRRVSPSLFLDQSRGFRNGFNVVIAGIDTDDLKDGDIKLHLGRQAKKHLQNVTAKLFVQSGGQGTKEEIAKMAWEQASTKIGYSVLQKPTSENKAIDDNNVIQAYIPELTSGLSIPDTAIVMIESAAQGWKLTSKEMRERFEFLEPQYKKGNQINWGALFDEGKLVATDPLVQKNGKVLHKLMVKDDTGLWKTIPNFSSDKVAASDYFHLGNTKILENRTWNTNNFDGSGD